METEPQAQRFLRRDPAVACFHARLGVTGNGRVAPQKNAALAALFKTLRLRLCPILVLLKTRSLQLGVDRLGGDLMSK